MTFLKASTETAKAQAKHYRIWAARCLRRDGFFANSPGKAEGAAYERMLGYCNGPSHVPIVYGADRKERALFLCFMAAMVEAGDA